MNFNDKTKELREILQKQMLTYLGAGFGFVAGLAWNDAISSLIDYAFPSFRNTVVAKFAYALLLTLIVGIIVTYLQKSLKATAKKMGDKEGA